MHNGNSLDSGHYFIDLFNFNTEMWRKCDDDEITQISGFPEALYTKESHKQKIHKRHKNRLWQAQTK